MNTISLQEFQRDPLSLLQRIEAGETLLLTNSDRVVAELRPVELLCTLPRPYGLAAGQFVVPPEFDDPLPEEILAAFEGQ